MNDLYIIGNGFDLYCGLETSFANFQNYIRNNRIDFLKNNIFAALFEIAFFGNDDDFKNSDRNKSLEKYKISNKYWMDVEQFLLEFLIDYDFKIYADLKDEYEKLINNSDNNDNNNDDEYEFPIPDLLYSVLIAGFAKMSKYRDKNFSSYLLLQLNEYEQEFSDYLKLQESLDKSITKIKCKLFFDIIFGKATPSKGNYNKISVLDFNYTPMPKLTLGESVVPADYIYVHGNINANAQNLKQTFQMYYDSSPIIIGYDSTGIVKEEEKIEKYAESLSENKNIQTYNYYVDRFSSKINDNKIFSKTYRRLNLIGDYKKYNLPEKIRKIVFYGHSLGPQDYSYFQSLFDNYDLYNSNIVLEFCYSEYKNNPKEKRKLELDAAIHKLINKYGKTLDNKDHGNNLLHKLLLENRIITRFIPSRSKEDKPASP